MTSAAIGSENRFKTFRTTYPAFETTRRLDELRATEYGRLDRTGHVYLDHAGGALYAESHLRSHLALLADAVLGNPHSGSPASLASTELAQHTRRRVLDHFHASPDE